MKQNRFTLGGLALCLAAGASLSMNRQDIKPYTAGQDDSDGYEENWAYMQEVNSKPSSLVRREIVLGIGLVDLYDTPHGKAIVGIQTDDEQTIPAIEFIAQLINQIEPAEWPSVNEENPDSYMHD